MASNDTLDLIFDEPDVVSWAGAGVLIAALEEVHGAVLARYRDRTMEERTGPPQRAINAAAVIASSPKPGSLILPLLMQAPDIHINFVPATSAAGQNIGAVREFLGAAADMATIMTFVGAVLFGARGVVSRLTNQPTRAPEPEEEPAAAVAEASLEDGAKWVERLMDAAERTGCGRVRVRFRDVEVDLILKDRLTSSRRLGRAKPTRDPVHHQDPTQLNFSRLPAEPIRVVYGGENRIAFLATGGGPSAAVIMIGRIDKDLTSVGEKMTAKGMFVDRTEVRALDDIPDAWGDANGVFVITGIRQADFT